MPDTTGNGTRVAVVGSINSDLVLHTARIPSPGETVTASSSAVHNGGKGANQAVASARLGQGTALVGCVGSDANGARLMAALEANDVDTSMVATVEGPTGVAVIVVDKRGENTIVVNPGANALLTADLVAEAAGVIAPADVTLVQMEIPMEAVTAALAMATGTTLLNPAPATPLDASVLKHVDVLLPNRTELGILAGMDEPTTEPDIIKAVRTLPFDGIVVVTLGSVGAVAVLPDGTVVRTIPPAVRVVDTVGAGDAFCAGSARGVATGLDLSQSLTLATACGAHATTVRGAQPSMPTQEDADRWIRRVVVT